MDPLILYPAIDLKDGQCVRLFQGNMDQAVVFNNDPAAQAQLFEQAGFHWLHLVDLNGAFSGHSVNIDAIRAIRQTTSLPIQLGGGIRSLEAIEHWLNAGIDRIILGTIAVEKPEIVKEACALYPNRIAVAIDARNGVVSTQGWATETEKTALEFAREFEDMGVCTIIYTDIQRDGALSGINIASVSALARKISTPVIASGGLRDLDDLHLLKQHRHDGITGVISGRALYEKCFDYREALNILASD